MARTGNIISKCMVQLLVGFCWTVALLAQDKSPATVKEASWNFGYLAQKCEVSHQFYLVNSGLAPLAVQKIKADCSCTNVSKIEHPIAPGDSAAIILTFKSGRYLGLVKKSAEITTSDPVTPIVRLKITCNVVKDGGSTGIIAYSPRSLKIGDAESTLDTIKFTNESPENLRISVLQEPSDIKIEIPSSIGPGTTASMLLDNSSMPVSGEPVWSSATLAFVGKDTTIITVPMEFKK